MKSAVLILLALCAFLVRVWWLLSGPICYRCRLRRAIFELGDYPLCKTCWEWLDGCRNVQRGIDSDIADMEIREYYREHPKP